MGLRRRCDRGVTDTCLINRSVTTNYVTDLDDPTTVQHMCEAMHDILSTSINSHAQYPENIETGPMSWRIILVIVDVAVALVLVFFELKVVRKGYAKRKNSAEVKTGEA